MTNRYLEQHEDKTRVNNEIQRAEAAKRFWQFNKFNPVSVEFYDKNKEQEFKEKEELAKKTHGKDEVKKLPITV